MNFATVVYAFPISISTALTIIVSYEVGRKDIRSAMQFAYIGIATAVTLAVVTLTLLALNIQSVAALYGTDPDFIQLTVVFLTYSLLFQLFDAVAAPIQGTLRGFKDVQMPFILFLIGYWIIGLPIGFILDNAFNAGPYSYWIGLIIGLMSSCIFLVVRLRKVFKKYKESRGV